MSTGITINIDDDRLADAINESSAESPTDAINRALTLYAELDNSDELLAAEGHINPEEDAS